MTDIKVFNYYPELDAFLCTPEYKAVAAALDLSEWTPVVWIGRLFAMDQDFGEHWFDNWDEREQLEAKRLSFNFPPNDEWQSLLILRPEPFTAVDRRCISCGTQHKRLTCSKCNNNVYVGADGPCHSPVSKRKFWTDVLRHLHLSLDTLAEVAHSFHNFNHTEPSGLSVEHYLTVATEALKSYQLTTK